MPDRVARIWNGSAWEIISSQIGIPNAVATFQATGPSSPSTGQIWIDSDDNRIYVWNGTAWISGTVDFSLYATLSSPTFTGIPVAPTASVDTNTTQIATTAYVVNQGYAKLASPTFTGTVILPSSTSIGNVSSIEIGYLDGVTSAIQTQIDGKEKTIPLQNTAPLSPASSDLWVDNTDPTKPVLKVYNGTSWVTAGSSITADDDQIILASRVFG